MMYILYLLFFITNFAMCADLPIISSAKPIVSAPTIPSTPPQDIRGRHFRKISVVLSRKPSCAQEIKKDSPLKASQDDNEDLIEAAIEEMAAQKALEVDDELLFPVSE